MKKTILALALPVIALTACKKTETAPDYRPQIIGYYEGTLTDNSGTTAEKILIENTGVNGLAIKEYNSTTGQYDLLITTSTIKDANTSFVGNLNSTTTNGSVLTGVSTYQTTDGNKYDWGLNKTTNEITIGIAVNTGSATYDFVIEATKK